MFSEGIISNHKVDKMQLSDDQRLSVFAETGDSSVLTPTLAHRLKLSPDLAMDVAGLTDEDIVKAESHSQHTHAIYDNYFRQYGLDTKTLDELSNTDPILYLQHLTDIAQMLPSRTDRDKEDDDRNVIEHAKRLIIDYILESPERMIDLSQSVRLDSASGMRDVQILKLVHYYVYDRFITLSLTDLAPHDDPDSVNELGEKYASVLNYFASLSEEVLQIEEWLPHTNYLSAAYLENLALELKFSQPQTLDNEELSFISSMIGLERVSDLNPDTCLPFEISKGRWAMFGTDCNVLYVLDESTSAIYEADYIELMSHIRYTVQGYYFARRVVADVPEELYEETEVFYDVGKQFGRDAYTNFTNPELVRDFQFMMRHSMRETIQESFGISLADLSINEQIYFLNYLKYTSVADVETMKTFVMHYGVDAMRSFLTNSYDKKAAENIMIFGTVVEPDIATKVFSSYASSIDNTKNFGDKIITSAEADIAASTLMTELEQGMIKRAGHLFEAGKQFALSEHPSEESTADLVQAYEGVTTMTKVLASMDNREMFELQSLPRQSGGDASMQIFQFRLLERATNTPYTLKASIRPVATVGGEARINFELLLRDLPEDNDLRQAFLQTTHYKGTNGKNARTVVGSVIRFGFDLDTRTNPPTFSFDMGRDAYSGEDMERTGDVLGHILAQVAPTGHHLQDFDPSLSNPKNFQKIAESFIVYFERLSTTAVAEPQ